ncbi:MAG: 50S ribosomal protein L13 [Patescibacteria group bacterium]
MDYALDATDQILGRLATRIAVLLQGKRDSSFDPARAGGNRVVVVNTNRIRTTGRKGTQKIYRRHTGYPGGLKEETLERLRARDSRLVLRHAVLGMLPKNRLRARMMKDLILTKGEK